MSGTPELARSAKDLADEPALWAMLLVLALGTMMAMSQAEGTRLRFATLATDPPWWWPDRAPRPGRATAEKRFWGSLSPDEHAGWDSLFAEAMLSPWDDPAPELEPIARPVAAPAAVAPAAPVAHTAPVATPAPRQRPIRLHPVHASARPAAATTALPKRVVKLRPRQ